MTDLARLLDPISRKVAELDATDPEACERALSEAFPPGSPELERIREAAVQALEAGEICDRGEEPMRFSRIAKPEQTPGGASIDAVCMDSCAGPAHTHPEGEFCLCFPLAGEPTFEGRRDPWIVLPKGSRHTPTVEGGRMLILYWLPGGSVVWG